MSDHAATALAGLERDVLGMGDLVEMQLDSALASLVRRDAVLAEEVLRGDDQVDLCDVKIEAAGLEALSTHELTKEELRLVIAAVRVNTQLERIGDLAVNLAERALTLSERPPLETGDEVARMAARVQEMVRASVTALATRDGGLARRILDMDALVDELHRVAFDSFEKVMRADPDTVERAVLMLSCSRYLERVGDHAKNIAEDVIYLVDGRVVRHARGRRHMGEKMLITATGS
jgi:phosphate transport system protein